MDLNKINSRFLVKAESIDMASSKPTIHSNGTSAQALYDANIEALRALRKAIKALEEAAPNGRDYYTQGDTAFSAAKREHDARVSALVKVDKELSDLIEHIADHL